MRTQRGINCRDSDRDSDPDPDDGYRLAEYARVGTDDPH